MKKFLGKLKQKAVLGIVGGSDFPKMAEQMGGGDGKRSCGGHMSLHHVISVAHEYSMGRCVQPTVG